jgi:hypothetical protein
MAETPMTPVRVVEGQQARPRMPFEQSKEEIVQQSLMRKKEP